MWGYVMLCALLLSCRAEQQYRGWRVYNVPLAEAETKWSACQLWDDVRGQIACPPDVDGPGRAVIRNLGELLAQERPKRRSTNFFEAFRTQAEIEAQLATYDPALLTTSSIGTTAENRQITLVVINGAANASSVVLINGGLHAREWLGPMTVMWTIDYLMKTLPQQTELQAYEWQFVVVSNPDGYAYSQTDGNRLWRKNRRNAVPVSGCLGVDNNRNFADNWGVSGTSTNPCAVTYGGPSAGSEAETQALQAWMVRESGRAVLYVDVHTYFGSWTSIFGYAAGVYPSNYPTLLTAMERARTGLAINGLTYAIGQDADVLGAASGGSDDYAHTQAGIGAAYTVELRGNSFVAPVSDIPLAGSEFTAGLMAYLQLPASGGGAMQLAAAWTLLLLLSLSLVAVL